jgi:hypothetical protein
LVGKPERKRPLRRPRSRLMNDTSIKICLIERERERERERQD